ncbi:hypothetical protein P175DRAFT_0492829 [Aspergillus ochraceoroseus IBT 24754]|uniref:WSC domain-containing protein n=2 Tax=Aspergillus ochraceoroseus TaxID=138278 RepID=A0A2T5LW18_9EURO|nr:uncharacterized protein P175DRAFT_0492829 [Aspergillus ochraceoroseus IBT 24754]KKK22186.1 hypothetical protein AOCH_001492 [Aspergillus ochraceoroseus]PTU20475.1 hypothetical protein P175DRAFT_0492829 [Aspergillus ochraceoroseus IBT 24754]
MASTAVSTTTAATTTTTATASTTTFALSTVFTAPLSCSSSWTYEASTYNNITSGILMQNVLLGYRDTRCFPTGFNQAGRIAANVVFSPGACPHGYVTQSPILVVSSTTTATCCPEDLPNYESNGYQGCLGTYTGATSVAARAGGFGSADYTTSTSISGTYQMWGQPITVEFEASDMSLYKTATMTSTSSTSSPSSTPPTSSPSSTSSKLSSGSKAGIAVGATVGGLVVLGLLIFWLLMMRRKHKQPGRAISRKGLQSQEAELEAKEAHLELDAMVYELPDSQIGI